jgi:hypothetical protein
MKNTVLTILIGFFISSCATYMDRKNLKNRFYDFEVYETYNVFKKIDPINSCADTEVYIRNHYEIKLPKNIVNWQTGTNDIFEYPSKQIIFIKGGFSKKQNEWIFRNVTEEEILNFLESYWHKRGYNSNYLENLNSKRISKIYTDNNTTILLFNIKPNSFETFKNLILTFKYIKR